MSIVRSYVCPDCGLCFTPFEAHQTESNWECPDCLKRLHEAVPMVENDFTVPDPQKESLTQLDTARQVVQHDPTFNPTTGETEEETAARIRAVAELGEVIREGRRMYGLPT